MYRSALRFPAVAFPFMRLCRTCALIALVVLLSGGVLGVAVSVHMAQVFQRVTSVHAAALPPAAVGARLVFVRDSL